mgnify:CR=1 FL=1|jgi:hypothetical protein|tara:strand:+ start:770 stop:1399 length:630 start_codon:yes stop_codon:yes gene_type:complete
MALLKELTSTETAAAHGKVFHGLRRTPEGMLYLTTINPNSSDKHDIQFSDFFEPGKSDLVPKDGSTDYTDERLELFNVQYFTGDNSTVSFTLNANDIKPENVAVFKDGVRMTAYSDYNISGTSLSFTLKPVNNSSISIGQINKRYKNNDSDRYQQFVYDDNSTSSYHINSNGDLVRRRNNADTKSVITDDFDTFEASSTINSTSWQSAV